MSAIYDRPTTLPDAYRTLLPADAREPLHTHPHQTTIAVLEGVLYLVSEEDERPMTPGDQAVIGAGEPHRIFNAGDGPAHVLEGARLERCVRDSRAL